VKGRLIARIWHGVTDAARADEYAEFTFISLWDSLEAIRRFAGEDYEKARYYSKYREFLVELEPFVDRYEVIAGD